jgi:hypothetical protein
MLEKICSSTYIADVKKPDACHIEVTLNRRWRDKTRTSQLHCALLAVCLSVETGSAVID